MICVIEPAAHVVWGFGHTREAAMQRGQKEIREYTGPEKIGQLEYARLKAEADTEADGAVLWRWVELIDEEEPEQNALF